MKYCALCGSNKSHRIGTTYFWHGHTSKYSCNVFSCLCLFFTIMAREKLVGLCGIKQGHPFVENTPIGKKFNQIGMMIVLWTLQKERDEHIPEINGNCKASNSNDNSQNNHSTSVTPDSGALSTNCYFISWRSCQLDNRPSFKTGGERLNHGTWTGSRTWWLKAKKKSYIWCCQQHPTSCENFQDGTDSDELSVPMWSVKQLNVD